MIINFKDTNNTNIISNSKKKYMIKNNICKKNINKKN